MSKPLAFFPSNMAYGNHILPKHKLEKLSPKELLNPTEFLRHPIGSSPFKFKEFVPGSYLTVVANEDFYHRAPHIDAVIFKIIPDIDAQIAQLQTGQLDMIILEPH
jgi:peptide/nickel transport system substrate-binding protein